MNKIIVKIGSLAISSATKRSIYISPSLYAKPPLSFRSFTSESSTNDPIPSDSEPPTNPNVHNYTREELKERIDKFFAGCAKPKPESDDDFMQDFHPKITVDEAMRKEVDKAMSKDIDFSDFDTDEDTSDDEGHKG